MLQKMGWSEGKGLGKNENGRTNHVKVALRADNVGEFSASTKRFLPSLCKFCLAPQELA
jgi:hypothetical protein